MPRAKKTEGPPAECPVCGAEVPPRARACPECGADERSGWNEESTRYDGLNLPDEAFEDDATSSHGESLRKSARKNARIFWTVVGAALLAAMIYLVLRGAF